jgi:hypothetical protein
MSRYDIGDILVSNLCEDIVVILNNDVTLYVTYSFRRKEICNYHLSNFMWTKLNV